MNSDFDNQKVVARLFDLDPDSDDGAAVMTELLAENALYDLVGVEKMKGRKRITEMWLEKRRQPPFRKDVMRVRSINGVGDLVYVEQSAQIYNRKMKPLLLIFFMSVFRVKDQQIVEWKDYLAPEYSSDPTDDEKDDAEERQRSGGRLARIVL